MVILGVGDLSQYCRRKKKAESYLSAAKRYYLTSDWKDEMQRVIPKINNWWQKDGRHLSKKIARAIGVKEPNIYNINHNSFWFGWRI